MLLDIAWASAPRFAAFRAAVDASGCVWRNRWGDLPLWGAMLMLHGDAAATQADALGVWYVHGSHDRRAVAPARGGARWSPPRDSGANAAVRRRTMAVTVSAKQPPPLSRQEPCAAGTVGGHQGTPATALSLSSTTTMTMALLKKDAARNRPEVFRLISPNTW
jgi:hypothetical protein